MIVPKNVSIIPIIDQIQGDFASNPNVNPFKFHLISAHNPQLPKGLWASKAMTATPAFSGSKSVRSWLPPPPIPHEERRVGYIDIMRRECSFQRMIQAVFLYTVHFFIFVFVTEKVYDGLKTGENKPHSLHLQLQTPLTTLLPSSAARTLLDSNGLVESPWHATGHATQLLLASNQSGHSRW